MEIQSVGSGAPPPFAEAARRRPGALVARRQSAVQVASQQSKMSLGSLLTDDSSIVSPESSISMVSSSPETSISISTVFPHPGLRR